MSDDEMRVAIAEACGWRLRRHLSKWATFSPDGREVSWGEESRMSLYHLPDYLKDLNAMHEAEKVLTEAKYSKFALRLGPLTNQRVREYISATARQRAEAFLRTLHPEKFNH